MNFKKPTVEHFLSILYCLGLFTSDDRLYEFKLREHAKYRYFKDQYGQYHQ